MPGIRRSCPICRGAHAQHVVTQALNRFPEWGTAVYVNRKARLEWGVSLWWQTKPVGCPFAHMSPASAGWEEAHWFTPADINRELAEARARGAPAEGLARVERLVCFGLYLADGRIPAAEVGDVMSGLNLQNRAPDKVWAWLEEWEHTCAR